MRIETTDPITINDVTELDNAPSVIKAQGNNALKIYFKIRIPIPRINHHRDDSADRSGT